MDQIVFNIIFGALFTLFGAVIKAIWDGVKELQKADKELTKKIGEIEVLVAGDYARKDYVEGKIDAIFVKLDKLGDKMEDIRKEITR
jgi:hypothetical protein